jgi:hypothetical protein
MRFKMRKEEGMEKHPRERGKRRGMRMEKRGEKRRNEGTI